MESSEFTIRLRDSAPSPAEVSATFTLQVQEPEEGGPDVAVIAVTSRRAVLRYNTSAGQACEIKVGDNAAVEPPVFSTLDGGGRLRREFVLGQPAALTPNRQYWVKVVCPSGGTVRSFQTPPTRGAGLSPLKVRVPSLSVRQAAAVEIRYGDSALLGNSVTQSCPAGCEVNLSVPSDEVVYFQIVYKDAGSQTIAASGVRVTAIP